MTTLVRFARCRPVAIVLLGICVVAPTTAHAWPMMHGSNGFTSEVPSGVISVQAATGGEMDEIREALRLMRQQIEETREAVSLSREAAERAADAAERAAAAAEASAEAARRAVEARQ